jgi:hypothetical protein
MSSEYPDVLGDLVDARQRFEVNGVHYLMALQPATIAPGETTAFQVWLQSCWNVPVEVSITLQLPLRPTPALSIAQERTDVPLQAAEVGELTIPIACGPESLPGPYPLQIKVQAGFENRGQYVRSKRAESSWADPLLAFVQGTGLAQVMGTSFDAATRIDHQLDLTVQGSPQPLPEPDVTPTFVSHWTVPELAIQGKARQLVNDQRLYLVPHLGREALYVAFLEESRTRFAAAGLTLHIGEALFVARILTYTAEHFLRRPDWQDAVLVPAYALAFQYDLPTTDPVFLVARADYARLARLAISLSFGLLRRHLGRDVWTPEEQLAVSGLVTDRVERGGSLPAEFLYLPLLLGSLLVAGDVQMPGEKMGQSLALLAQARQKRTADLAENPELQTLFDQLHRRASSA